MSLNLIRLLHTQRLDLLLETTPHPPLSEEPWLAAHADLLDAYTDIGLDLLLDKRMARDIRKAAMRRLVDLVFTAGGRASLAAATEAPAPLDGPLPVEPEEEATEELPEEPEEETGAEDAGDGGT